MKNVLITGGTGGIGTALVKEFVEKGYYAIVSHNNKSKSFLEKWLVENKLSSDSVEFINLDLNKVPNTINIIDNLIKKKHVDILINNAGINSDATFLNMSFEQWSAVLNTNLVALYGITNGIAKHMASRGSGKIINISSINGLKGQYGQTNYSASKAGIIGFTKALSLELARKGISVNAICPGYTMTPMVSGIPPKILEKILNEIPTKQLVEPDEVAKTALFIAESNKSLTGETISINGGHYIK